MRKGPEVHLNLNIRGMRASATVASNERANELRAGGRDVFKLGLGQSPFPVPESVVDALRMHAHEKDYLPVRGLYGLRASISAYLNQREDLKRSADDVLVGPGTKELMFLLQLVFYGDLVIPTPAWVSYAPQARIIGRRVCFIPTAKEDGWQLKPEALERLCKDDSSRPRILILNYPSNPTGGTFRLEDLRTLAKVARQHKVVLLSDEIYGETHHRGQHVSISRFYPEGTIISTGLSKWCGAGGWRLGAFYFPPGLRWLLDAMASAASETYTSTSAPIQYAAITAFDGGPFMDEYLLKTRRILSALTRWCTHRMTDAGLDCTRPSGGFYLFPDLYWFRDRLRARGITNSHEMTERLLDDTGVAVLPGVEFGRPLDELTIRIAAVDFDGGLALDALDNQPQNERLGEEFLRNSCGRVLDAVDRICDWAVK